MVLTKSYTNIKTILAQKSIINHNDEYNLSNSFPNHFYEISIICSYKVTTIIEIIYLKRYNSQRKEVLS